jgi:hypothetical protein
MYSNRSQDYSKSQAYKDIAMSTTPISVQTFKELWENPNISLWEKAVTTLTVPFVGQGISEGQGPAHKASKSKTPGAAPVGLKRAPAGFGAAP